MVTLVLCRVMVVGPSEDTREGRREEGRQERCLLVIGVEIVWSQQNGQRLELFLTLVYDVMRKHRST